MTEATAGIEQWDLTSTISPFLDRHMMFPLLEYLDSLINSGAIRYSSKDVVAARLSLLRPTHMVDYAIDMYKGLHGDDAVIPQEMEDQKAKVYERMEKLRSGCASLDDLCRKEDEKVRLCVGTRMQQYGTRCLERGGWNENGSYLHACIHTYLHPFKLTQLLYTLVLSPLAPCPNPPPLQQTTEQTQGIRSVEHPSVVPNDGTQNHTGSRRIVPAVGQVQL